MSLSSHFSSDLCPHGMAGYCEDCPPERFSIGHDLAAPSAAVRPKREGFWVVVERTTAHRTYDWFTWHLTRRGARRAVALYLRTGKVKGIRP